MQIMTQLTRSRHWSVCMDYVWTTWCLQTGWGKSGTPFFCISGVNNSWRLLTTWRTFTAYKNSRLAVEFTHLFRPTAVMGAVSFAIEWPYIVIFLSTFNTTTGASTCGNSTWLDTCMHSGWLQTVTQIMLIYPHMGGQGFHIVTVSYLVQRHALALVHWTCATPLN